MSVGKTVENSGRNGGKLRVGNPGNRGGGRPKDKVREACALAFEKRIPALASIADGKVEGASVGDRIKAIDTLGKYAGLQKIETENLNTTLDDLMREAEKFAGDGAA